MRHWLLGITLITGLAAHAASYGTFESMWGSPECVASIGNGGLTLGVDASGCVTVCRWPGPGSPTQVALPAPGGMLWALRYGGATRWLDQLTAGVSPQRDGTTLKAVSTLPGLDASLVQEMTVHPEKDVACIRLRVSGAPEDLEVFWYADLSPDDRVLPELPDAGCLPENLRDFAAYVDTSKRTVFHFRPTGLSSIDWRDAEKWARQGSTPPPAEIAREGVWIGYAVEEPGSFAWCGPAGGAQSVREQIALGKTGSASVATGQTASGAAFPGSAGESKRIATIYMAFGTSHEEVLAGLQYAAERGYEGLLEEARHYAQQVTSGSPLLSQAAPEIANALLDYQFTLAAALDRGSGAIVRAPLSRPPLALDIPRHSVWASLALDVLGQTEAAERHLAFLLAAVRTQDRPGMPAGSLPAALHTNGTQGIPHVVLDGEVPAWLLWAVWQHAALMDTESGKAFLSRNWGSVQLMAIFLMNRSGVRPGATAYSFSPEFLGENESATFSISAYVGLTSAAAIAEHLGEERPEWLACLRDLEDRILTWFDETCADPGAQDQALALWPAALVDTDDPRWEPVTAAALHSLESAPPEKALLAMFQLAMLWREQPSKLAQLAPVLPEVMLRAQAVRPLDSLDAARALLTGAAIEGQLQLR